MERKVELSIVIPVYNTSVILKRLTNDIINVLRTNNISYEILLVDDYSPNQDTWTSVQDVTNTFQHVKGIRLTRNFGQQPATLCGLSLSKGDYIITMDDDYQHAPADIMRLWEKREYDIVIGHLTKKTHGFSRRMASKLKGYFDHIILGKPKGIQLSAFRLFNRSVVDGMLQIKTPTPFIPALMFYVSKNVTSVKIPHHERMEGNSGYTLGKMLKLFSFLLINNSSLLLQIIGNIGLLIAGGSLVFIFIAVLQYFVLGTSVTGWTSTIVALVFFGGLQLFTLGIIGEYLIRIIRSVEEKPAFVVKTIITKNNELESANKHQTVTTR